MALPKTLSEIWITLENQRLMATRSQQDITNHITAPDKVCLQSKTLKVVSSGIVKDQFFRDIEPVKHRPQCVKLECIPGKAAARVQFIVTGTGDFSVTYDSVKGGFLEKTSATVTTDKY